MSRRLHEEFTSLGCNCYFKTIYLGYEHQGEMVGALYKHEGHIELALALADDHPSDLLIDATHLTWRTLPVAAVIPSDAELQTALMLIQEAHARVLNSTHSVYRDNEYFTQHKTPRWPGKD